jgi:hypothetical protein
MEATTLSSEGRTDHLFKLFTGPAEDSFRALPCAGWEKSLDGMFTSFTAQAGPVETFLKILFDEPVPIVVNQVYFKRL